MRNGAHKMVCKTTLERPLQAGGTEGPAPLVGESSDALHCKQTVLNIPQYIIPVITDLLLYQPSKELSISRRNVS